MQPEEVEADIVDVDGDGSPDIAIVNTNGKQVFFSLRLCLVVAAAAVSIFTGYVVFEGV